MRVGRDLVGVVERRSEDQRPPGVRGARFRDEGGLLLLGRLDRGHDRRIHELLLAAPPRCGPKPIPGLEWDPDRQTALDSAFRGAFGAWGVSGDFVTFLSRLRFM